MLEEAVKFIQQLGLPIFLILVLGWGLYRGLIWLGQEVFRPLVVNHLDFLSFMKKQEERQSLILENLTKTNAQILQELKNIDEFWKSRPNGK